MTLIHGFVSSFDEVKGEGEITSNDGVQFYFHCVAIADGSRTIAVGTPVIARRHVGLIGRDEAMDVQSRGA
jgi:cold shock CspA family protein